MPTGQTITRMESQWPITFKKKKVCLGEWKFPKTTVKIREVQGECDITKTKGREYFKEE